jgi:hypothetical protein
VGSTPASPAIHSIPLGKPMTKWIGSFLSLFLILILISIVGSSENSERSFGKKEEGQMIQTQYREGGEKKGEKDSYMVELLKELKQVVDGWLKSINDQIEREDVTRFKVRFLEILRSILEWVKDKIDSYLEPSEEETPGPKEKGRLREVHQKVLPFSEIG